MVSHFSVINRVSKWHVYLCFLLSGARGSIHFCFCPVLHMSHSLWLKVRTPEHPFSEHRSFLFLVNKRSQPSILSFIIFQLGTGTIFDQYKPYYGLPIEKASVYDLFFLSSIFIAIESRMDTWLRHWFFCPGALVRIFLAGQLTGMQRVFKEFI